MNYATFYTITLITGLALAIIINLALNAGCPDPLHTGVITAAGKVCIK